MQTGVILGFDFGFKRIGIAVGQLITRTATPLQIIAAQHGIPNWADIDLIMAEYQPIALVVGLPLNMDGTEQTLTQCARKFANRLYDRYHLKPHLVDERLTTREVKQSLFEQGGNRKLDKHHKKLDTLAAQIILEGWLKDH